MYLGLNETDCRVAEFRLQEMLTEAQRRCRTDKRPKTGTAGQSAARLWLESLLIRAGQRFSGRAPHLPAA
jgi:hypothetical protein